MQTRCPSCQNIVQFDAPSNVPAGYKHKIYCPYCNSVICVRFPGNTANAPQPAAPATAPVQPAPQAQPQAYQPQPQAQAQTYIPPSYQQPQPQVYQPQPQQAYQPQPQPRPQVRPIYDDYDDEVQTPPAANTAAFKSNEKPKYKGRARALTMLIFALILFAVSVIGTLYVGFGEKMYSEPMINYEGESEFVYNILESASAYDGLNRIWILTQDGGTEYVKALFKADIMLGISFILVIAFFLFTGIWLLISLIGVICGKFGKTGHMIMATLTFVSAAGVLICTGLTNLMGLGKTGEFFADILKDIAETSWMIFVIIGIALAAFVTAIVACAKKKKLAVK